ncbi:hypothetical protein DY000_02000428 [Brassica cretica]|uniref:Uncharacterized protein n=1 Tax=Brassica cretica TaxID=69181 RepID=A0ABQ7C674_BRACR|nr:hypothetical protein DY000_02000428 [Brassica cretica]
MTEDSGELAAPGEIRPALANLTNLPKKRGASSISSDSLDSPRVEFSKRLCVVVDDLVKQNGSSSSDSKCSSEDDKGSGGDAIVEVSSGDAKPSKEIYFEPGDRDCAREFKTDEGLALSLLSSSDAEIRKELGSCQNLRSFEMSRCSNVDKEEHVNVNMGDDDDLIKSCSCSFCLKESQVKKRWRCGLLGLVGRCGLRSKRSTATNGSHKSTMSSSNASTACTPNIQFTKSPGIELNAKKLQEHKVSPEPIQLPDQIQKNISNPSPNQNPNNQHLDNNGNQQESNNLEPVQQQARKVPREAIGLSGELESMIIDNQKAKGINGSMVRASSGNVMLFGNLGNLKQPGTAAVGNKNNVQDTEERKTSSVAPTLVSDNQEQSGTLCREVSTRMDPETLKTMGNEDYKNGNYVEALALYDAAIAIDPKKAAYRSNKSAALAALGRILEAVFECKEAIRMEPHYHKAQHRLAYLYLRLGEVENSIYHFKHSGPEADQEDVLKAKTVQTLLNKCTEAKRLRDWNTLIKETENTIASGADAAPHVFALQAEAFLKSLRHQEADDAMSRCPVLDVEMSTKYYGPISSAGFLVVWAQVHMSSGRFGEAVEAIQRANKLDGNNREVSMVLRRAQAVMAARSKGNDYFKAGRFQEASAAYGEGLDHDSRNSVLLCNRAACLSKMGKFDRAVEDCTAALTVRPAYTKARLRRADCNAKLGNWESAFRDYEILSKETPEDEEVIRGLSEAQEQLVKCQGHRETDQEVTD